MRQVIVMLLLVGGLFGGLFISKPFESSVAHTLAAYWAGGSPSKKPEYCKEIVQEAPDLEDALKALDEPGAIYCPGFDYTTNACRQHQQAIKQAIKLCFTTS